MRLIAPCKHYARSLSCLCIMRENLIVLAVPLYSYFFLFLTPLNLAARVRKHTAQFLIVVSYAHCCQESCHCAGSTQCCPGIVRRSLFRLSLFRLCCSMCQYLILANSLVDTAIWQTHLWNIGRSGDLVISSSDTGKLICVNI